MSKQMWIPCEHGSVGDCEEGGVIWSCPGGRLATTADLVAALREEEVGEVVESFRVYDNAGDWDLEVIAVDPGRYLVVRIDGEET